MQILIVDDSEDSRDITEAALLSGGYADIGQADSGWSAFKLLDIGAPTAAPPAADIILLDVMMPEIDGIETCARIRSDARYVDVPIIMVTSLDDMQSLASAFVAGASDYVTKPVNRIELIARVRSALKLKGELDRRQARERELLGFLSNWGDRKASGWIDEATGLIIGEGAEAYLTAISERDPGAQMSVLAMAVDRLDVLRDAKGPEVARGILAAIANTIREEAATIGVIAAAYPNGMVVVVAPRCDAATARGLAETLRRAVARLALANRESIAADHVTVSVSVATGATGDKTRRVKLFTEAIFEAQRATAAGGDRVVALTL